MRNGKIEGIYELAAQVSRWRQHHNWSQAELESRAGLAHNAISRIERGQVSPRLDTIERIAVALGLGVEELQFRVPPAEMSEVRDDEAEYLVHRLDGLDSRRREGILRAFHMLLDQVDVIA